MNDDLPEQLTRIALLLGRPAVEKLRHAKVVVVGIGAVGGYVVEGLARAGIGTLRLVDFDLVKTSNLNRQILALHSTLGQPKVTLAEKRVHDINPECCVESLPMFAHTETFSTILDGTPDLVIDAIDSLTPKAHLIAELHRRGIPALSSMGAALRRDPTMIRVGTIAAAHRCPLARSVRKRLRHMDVPLTLRCVYSDEPLPHDAIRATDGAGEDVLERGRVRNTLGSLPTLTGIFGLTLANEAIRQLTEHKAP